MDQKRWQTSPGFRPLAAAPSTPSIAPGHTWFPHGARIKYPIHYVHSIPGGDWNKKLFWQKSLGNETRERWGKRKRKIEMKNRKKHSTRWMEWVQNHLQLQSWKKKKKTNTWAHCEIRSVFSMCVPKRASHRSEPWAEKRNSLSHKDGISVFKFRKEVFIHKDSFLLPCQK